MTGRCVLRVQRVVDGQIVDQHPRFIPRDRLGAEVYAEILEPAGYIVHLAIHPEGHPWPPTPEE